MKTKNHFLFLLLITLILPSCNLLEENDEILIVTPSVETFEINEVDITSCVINYEINKDGGADITETGICWSEQTDPTINDSHKKSDTNNQKSYNVTIDGLSDGNTYHIRAYAKNKSGVGYSFTITIETLGGETAISTQDATAICATKSTLNGSLSTIKNFTLTEKGFCWSTSSNPTTSDSFIIDGTTTTGVYSSNITGLTENTLYYIRAYASDGSEIIYGDEVSFTTLAKVTTLQPGPTDGKCTYIRSLWPTDNAGGALFVAMAWTVSGAPTVGRTLIDFDYSSIPEGTTIQSAYLSLYNAAPTVNYDGKHSDAATYPATGGDNACYLRRITSSWEASTVSWNTHPTYSTTNQVTLPPSTDIYQDYPDIDITPLIQDIINDKSGSHGILIMLATEEYYRMLQFGGSENVDPTVRPKLVINIQ